jgi:Protein of unknown function (DUF3592)
MKKHRQKTAPFLIFLGVFSFLGVVLISYTFYSFYNGFRSRLWPKTSGVVLSSVLDEKTLTCKMIYQYRVGKNDYSSARISYGVISRSYLETYETYLMYKCGMEVNVYYNPVNPSMAVLEPGIHRCWVFFYMVVFFIFVWLIVFGIFMRSDS